MTATTPAAMHTAQVNVHGQVTVPAAVRRALGVKPGDKIHFTIDGGQVTVTGAAATTSEAEHAFYADPANQEPQGDAAHLIRVLRQPGHDFYADPANRDAANVMRTLRQADQDADDAGDYVRAMRQADDEADEASWQCMDAEAAALDGRTTEQVAADLLASLGLNR